MTHSNNQPQPDQSLAALDETLQAFDGIPELWDVEAECTRCGAAAGACALRRRLAGRICCLACNHAVSEVEAS